MELPEIFERYYLGSLSNEERSDFEAQLESDEKMRSSYEEFVLTTRAIDVYGRKKLRNVLIRHQAIKKKGRRRSLTIWMLSAAAIALLALSFIFLIKPKNTQQDLFAEYFELYRDPVSVRGATEDDTHRQSAYDAYANRDFDRAAIAFDMVDELNDADHLYNGLSSLMQGKNEEAIRFFVNLSNSRSDYMLIGRWYLAMAYLKNEDLVNTRQVLEDLQKRGGYKSADAGEILALIAE